MRKLVMTLSAALFLQAHAQEGWTVWQCMDYAVENNHDVRIASLSLDNSKADRLRAVGDFLPSIGAGIGGQFNFGRAIDPQTNAYTDVSTFNNSYSVSASLPLFDGFARVHSLNAARADLLKGKNRLLQQRGQTALATFQAFVNVLYYKGTVLLAEKKLAESGAVLEQTRVLEEIGRKSRADVAQVESQYATDDYSLTQQRNALALAMLALKTAMNYPLAEALLIDERSADLFHVAEAGEAVDFSADAVAYNPEVQQSYHAMVSARHHLRLSRSSLFPTVSVSAGIGTNYNKVLHMDDTKSFSEQFRNNRGEYVGVSVNIPLFSRLGVVTNIRKARNNYRMACEEYERKNVELQKLLAEAVLDFRGGLKECGQLEKKVESDSIAYELVRNQYDEGLATAIDLQTASSTLLGSRVSLLRTRLTTVMKEQQIRYYTNK